MNIHIKGNGYMTTLFESKYYTASNSWVDVNFEWERTREERAVLLFKVV